MAILDTNNYLGIDALQNYASSEIQRANLDLYNADVRRQNMAELGKLLMSGGKSGIQTYRAAQKMSQQNQANQVGISETAAANPNDTDPALQGGGGSTGLNSAQSASLIGMFLRGLSSYGAAAGAGAG